MVVQIGLIFHGTENREALNPPMYLGLRP